MATTYSVLECDTQQFGEMAAAFLASGVSLRFRAKGQSMRPLIRDGDILLAEPVDPHKARRGAVLLFTNAQGRAVAHRVQRKRKASDGGAKFLMRGDQVEMNDGWVSEKDVLGVVSVVERNGASYRLDSFAQKGLGFGATLYQPGKPINHAVFSFGYWLMRKLPRMKRFLLKEEY